MKNDKDQDGVYPMFEPPHVFTVPNAFDRNLIRREQAQTYYFKAGCSDSGLGTFEEYVAPVPPIPLSLAAFDPQFPALVLVDERIGYARLRRMAGVVVNDRVPIPIGPPKDPYWIRIGRRSAQGNGMDIGLFEALSYFIQIYAAKLYPKMYIGGVSVEEGEKQLYARAEVYTKTVALEISPVESGRGIVWAVKRER